MSTIVVKTTVLYNMHLFVDLKKNKQKPDTIHSLNHWF